MGAGRVNEDDRRLVVGVGVARVGLEVSVDGERRVVNERMEEWEEDQSTSRSREEGREW